MTSREDLRAAVGDVRTFGRLIGWPLTETQADALALRKRQTVIVAPRQTGKSYALAILAAWYSFAHPDSLVLIVSAGEGAANELHRTIRLVCSSELLAGSVSDESQSLVTLSNGSRIMSVPSSERQVRGKAVDLLILDEAALITDDLIYGAAIPTTSARPDARIVLASSPWADEGAFYRLHLEGQDAAHPHTETIRWTIQDAPWITPAVVEAARATLPPLRFAAEYLAQFTGAADAFLDPADIKAAVAGYQLLPPADARGEEAVLGLDWGNRFDSHAIVAVAVLEDFGLNGLDNPILFLPWVESSQRTYSDQLDAVVAMVRDPKQVAWSHRHGFYEQIGGGLAYADGAGLAAAERRRKVAAAPGYSITRIVTELNGVGAMPGEQLAERLRTSGVREISGIHTSAQSKEDNYGRLRVLLAQRRIVLPDHSDLLRQLAGLRAEVRKSGSIAIEASSAATHDDLPDALSLALSAIELPLAPQGAAPPQPDELEFVTTEGGVHVPIRPRPRTAGLRPRASVAGSF